MRFRVVVSTWPSSSRVLMSKAHELITAAKVMSVYPAWLFGDRFTVLLPLR